MNSICNRLLAMLATTLVATLVCSLSVAATTPTPAAQATLDALTRAHSAVVGLQITAAEGARSAETLGKERSGSGVVIGTCECRMNTPRIGRLKFPQFEG